MTETSLHDDVAAIVEIERTEKLEADPAILGAIGRGHSLPTAIADLVDNSIDAGAEHVGIRFLVDDNRVTGLQIRDDGTGMTATQLRSAMTLGARRNYANGALGHFGMGLKASSMSQARVLTVFTKSGFEPVAACRLRRHDAGGQLEVEILTARAAWDGFDRAVEQKIVESGTIMEWAGLDGVSSARDSADRRGWLDSVINKLRQELGLTFHRLLSAGTVSIEIDQFDIRLGRPGVPRTVDAVDPFGFHQEGKTGYPKAVLSTTASGAPLRALCHILPAGASGPSARLLGDRRARWQGLYIYRNDRLLQAGGWQSLLPEASDVQLARVEIDITEDLLGDIAINPEKHGVVLRPDLVHALESGRSELDGTTFRSYLDDARSVMQVANRRATQVRPVTEVSRGLPATVLTTIDDELRHREEARPITVRWRQLDVGQLFWVEHGTRTLWLNAAYRMRLGGAGLGFAGDASLVKTTLFLLLEEYFAKERLVQSALDQINAWHSVLAAAMAAQFDINVIEPDQPDQHTTSSDREPPDVFAGLDEADAPEPLPRDPLPALGDGGREPSISDVEALILRDAEDDIEPQPGLASVKLSDDPVKDYLRRAGKAKLLSAEEEVELAVRIETGVFAQERLTQGVNLSRIVQRELQWISRDGKKAQASMFAANMRLVISLAGRYNGQGLEFLDLIQEGNFGLLRAIEKFDYTLGNKFSTYATWWIRQGMSRAVADQGRTIRIPVHMVEQINKVRKVKNQIEAVSIRSATFNEIAVIADLTPAEVATILSFDQLPISLDDVVFDGFENGVASWVPFGEVIEDNHAVSAEEHYARIFLRQHLTELLDSLSEREAGVIELRYGLNGAEPKTLEQIAGSFGVTRERIRQIEAKTLEKLRHPSRTDAFRDYLFEGASDKGEEVTTDPNLNKHSEAGVLESPRRPTPANVQMSAQVRWAHLEVDREPTNVVMPQAFASPPVLPLDPKVVDISPPGSAPQAKPDLSIAESEVTDVDRPQPDALPPESPEVAESLESPESVKAAGRPATTALRWWNMEQPDLPTMVSTDFTLIDGLFNGQTIEEIAQSTNRDGKSVVARLAELLFGVSGDLDATEFAPRHGHSYEHDERDRILWEYKRNMGVERIAAHFGRTVLAISWQLFDSPLRPVTVPKRLRKAARRIAMSSAEGLAD